MLTSSRLRQRVADFQTECNAFCADAERIVLASRALMRIPQHARQSRHVSRSEIARDASSEKAVEVFARRAEGLFRLISTDLDLALTYINIAEQTVDASRKHRLAWNALIAYETALRFEPRIAPPPDRKRELDAKLHTLKSKLIALTKNSPKVAGTPEQGGLAVDHS